MTRLTDHTSYADAQALFSTAALWALFDGGRAALNITHECVDRHAGGGRVALRIAHAEGRDETITFAALGAAASRVAHWLRAEGVAKGDRVAIMLEPSLPFYAALFGAMKCGAVAVPLFTLFGPDAVDLRLADCTPRLLLTTAEKRAAIGAREDVAVIAFDAAFLGGLADRPEVFAADTTAADMAIFQYTSGTTRAMPEAIRHTHRAVVVVMNAALYGTGLRPGDRFFCPSSPAWGHGLWHGTLAPLALGIETGAYAGRFAADRLVAALEAFRTTNLSAAATHYRLMRDSLAGGRHRIPIEKLSFTGEPIDEATSEAIERVFGRPLCSMYGTTEIGVILANYPGAEDFIVKPGALGRPVPGVEVEVQRPDGTRCAAGELGEIKVRRHGAWVATKDRGRVDAEGYFFHAGRADDVIISAGWTMSAIEIEAALLRHAAVAEAAAIGVPDATRGQIVKAFIVARPGVATDAALAADIQDFVRSRLGAHEFPRALAFVVALPRTPAGKINRKTLRDQERDTP